CARWLLRTYAMDYW
nr:immunoglobulin heavy chain junction region [Mus musculus]